VSKSISSTTHSNLAKLLAQARVEAGLTQNELASRLARTQSYISKYECGERRLDVSELIKISKAMGVRASIMVRQIEDANCND
jgi:transcriptional regulator with XRE-family HTH domain